jgi:hypothetical protein
VVLDQNVQGNGFVITDVIVQGVGGHHIGWQVEILENSTVKTRLGETSRDFNLSGAVTMGSSNTHFESGIPIQAGATLQARVWGESSSPSFVEVTISGYVW